MTRERDPSKDVDDLDASIDPRIVLADAGADRFPICDQGRGAPRNCKVRTTLSNDVTSAVLTRAGVG